MANDIKAIEKKLMKAVNQMVGKPFLDELGRRATEIIKLRTRLGYGVPESSGGEKPEKKSFEKLAESTIRNRKKALGEGKLGSKVTTETQKQRLSRQAKVTSSGDKAVKKAEKARTQKAIKALTSSGKFSTKIKRLKKATQLDKGAIRKKAEDKRSKKLAPGTSPSKSNLTFTGEMVESISYTATDRGVVITLDGDRNKKIGTYHMTGTNKMPQRRFLDLAKGDVNQLRLFMRQFFKTVFERLF